MWRGAVRRPFYLSCASIATQVVLDPRVSLSRPAAGGWTSARQQASLGHAVSQNPIIVSPSESSRPAAGGWARHRDHNHRTVGTLGLVTGRTPVFRPKISVDSLSLQAFVGPHPPTHASSRPRPSDSEFGRILLGTSPSARRPSPPANIILHLKGHDENGPNTPPFMYVPGTRHVSLMPPQQQARIPQPSRCLCPPRSNEPRTPPESKPSP